MAGVGISTSQATHRSRPSRRKQQLLGDDALDGGGDLHPDLLLLVRREHVDHPVDGLRAVLSVQGGEDQVPGLGGCQSGLDGLEVAHLPDQDHVGVLPQGPI